MSRPEWFLVLVLVCLHSSVAASLRLDGVFGDGLGQQSVLHARQDALAPASERTALIRRVNEDEGGHSPWSQGKSSETMPSRHPGTPRSPSPSSDHDPAGELGLPAALHDPERFVSGFKNMPTDLRKAALRERIVTTYSEQFRDVFQNPSHSAYPNVLRGIEAGLRNSLHRVDAGGDSARRRALLADLKDRTPAAHRQLLEHTAMRVYALAVYPEDARRVRLHADTTRLGQRSRDVDMSPERSSDEREPSKRGRASPHTLSMGSHESASSDSPNDSHMLRKRAPAPMLPTGMSVAALESHSHTPSPPSNSNEAARVPAEHLLQPNLMWPGFGNLRYSKRAKMLSARLLDTYWEAYKPRLAPPQHVGRSDAGMVRWLLEAKFQGYRLQLPEDPQTWYRNLKKLRPLATMARPVRLLDQVAHQALFVYVKHVYPFEWRHLGLRLPEPVPTTGPHSPPQLSPEPDHRSATQRGTASLPPRLPTYGLSPTGRSE